MSPRFPQLFFFLLVLKCKVLFHLPEKNMLIVVGLKNSSLSSKLKELPATVNRSKTHSTVYLLSTERSINMN